MTHSNQTESAARPAAALSSFSGELLSSSALLPGDIFLSLGESELSAGIHQLDGGDYSHAALWTGQGVVEATLPLVREVALENLTQRCAYVDVYRLREGIRSRDAVVVAGRRYLERPYGAVNLGVCALATAATSFMPGEWSQLNTLLGMGGLGRLMGLVTKAARGATLALSVTCVELVGRAYAEAELPITVRLDTPGTFEPRAFLRAVREVLGRLPSEIQGVDAAERAADLAWLVELDLPLAGGPNEQDWLPVHDAWWQFVRQQGAPPAPAAPGPARRAAAIRPQRLEMPVEQIRNLSLVVGVDWPPGLLTPRLVQTSPSLVLVGRLKKEPISP